MAARMEFRPDPEYATRCWLNLLLMLLGVVEWWLIPLGVWLWISVGPGAGLAALVLPNAVALLIAALYISAYVASIRYELTEEEVVVHKGVFTKVHKIVPYRTITNVTITRLWLDRLFLGIGNVDIQTAGRRRLHAEERLAASPTSSRCGTRSSPTCGGIAQTRARRWGWSDRECRRPIRRRIARDPGRAASDTQAAGNGEVGRRQDRRTRL